MMNYFETENQIYDLDDEEDIFEACKSPLLGEEDDVCDMINCFQNSIQTISDKINKKTRQIVFYKKCSKLRTEKRSIKRKHVSKSLFKKKYTPFFVIVLINHFNKNFKKIYKNDKMKRKKIKFLNKKKRINIET